MARLYKTGDGEVLRHGETNLHHVMSIGYGPNKQTYRTPRERRFRNMTGFVIRMSRDTHAELHWAVITPPKPNSNLMNDMLRFSQGLVDDDRFQNFLEIAHFLDGVVDRSTYQESVDDASSLVTNLRQQAPYIEQGSVVPYGVEEVAA